MQRFVKSIFGSLLLLLGVASARADYQPTWDSIAQHEAAPEWFQDAKFGIYFHWGVFSVPAYGNEWYPRWMYKTGDKFYNSHTATFGNPLDSSSPQFFPYDYFITGHNDLNGNFVQFAPVLKSQGGNWDPEAWAQLFLDAGARFAGPVAEHHDGYSMWNSTVNEWNSVAQGPHQDLAAIWATAIRGKGMKYLMAMHHAYNFNGFYQYAPTRSTDSLKKLYGQLGASAENQLWEAKLKEIIDGYHPDIIWQDFDLIHVDESRRQNFLSYYYNQAMAANQQVVATFKDGLNVASEVYDFERGGPADTLYPFWLSDESISPTSWSYTEGMKYYSAKALLHELIDCTSKNGSVVLNIAPKADGTIPVEQQNILLGMGDWLSRFGEGIYATRPWTIYGEGPTKMGGGQFSQPTAGTSADIRFTRNKANDTLYAIVLGWPGSQVNITSLNTMSFNASTLTEAQLLGATAGTYINLPTPTQDVTGMQISLPSQPYTAVAYVLKLKFSGQIPERVAPYSYQWSAPVAITTADPTLNLPGTIVGAAYFGTTTTPITVTTSNASIVFTGDGSVATCTGKGTANGAFTGNTGNTNFNTVLNGFKYDGGPHTITLKNLTPGQLYSVQLFALDDRGGVEKTRQSNFQTPGNAASSSATFTMGSNVYVVGTFVATGANMVIQQNLPNSNNGNLNALVIRQLTGADLMIVSQPPSIRVNSGGNARLSFYIAGDPSITCQWQTSAVGANAFTNTSAPSTLSSYAGMVSLNLTNVTTAADYRVVLTNSSGSITSSATTLTVAPPLFSWQTPKVMTTADATLNQPGTVVGAACFGSTSSSIPVALTNGTNIVFYGDGSVATCTSAGTGTGAYVGFTTGNAAFDSVLNGFASDGGPHLITLKNLVAGQRYSVQLFAVDDRRATGEEISRSFNYQDPQDASDISQTAYQGQTAYIIGTFTAPATSVVVQQNLLFGNKGNSNALVIRQLEPSAPTGLVATAGNGQVSLVWNAAAGAASYTVKRSTVNGGPYTTIVASGIAGTSYTDTTVANGTSYYYVVSAVNPVGESGGSSQIDAQPLSIAQVWRQQKFGAEWNNDAISGNNADPDNDGIVNLMERAFDGNPNSPDPIILPKIDPTQPPLSIIFRKAKAATDLSIEIQESTDLVQWQTVADTSVLVSQDSSSETRRFTTSSAAGDRRYVRLKIIAP